MADGLRFETGSAGNGGGLGGRLCDFVGGGVGDPASEPPQDHEDQNARDSQDTERQAVVAGVEGQDRGQQQRPQQRTELTIA